MRPQLGWAAQIETCTLLLALGGCGAEAHLGEEPRPLPGQTDAATPEGSDAAQETAAIAADAGAAPVDVAPAPPCTSTVTGAAGFGVSLKPSVGEPINHGASGPPLVRPTDITFQLYFPQGRRAGAPVVFAPIGGDFESVQHTQVRDDLSVALAASSFTGTLLGPDQGATGSVSFTHVDGDSGWSTGYAAVLCPSGPAPEPMVEERTSEILPIDLLELTTNVPPDAATLAMLSVDGSSVTIKGQTRLRITPSTGAWRLGARGISTAGVRDALGRPYAVSGDMRFHVVQPSAVVADLSFDHPLPPGAAAGPSSACITVVDGSLACELKDNATVAAIVGLGNLPGSGPLQVRHALWLDQSALSAAPLGVEAWLVSSDGVATSVALSRYPTEVSIEVRGSAPFYWVLKSTAAFFWSHPPERYALEELRR
jgi:hypothetical protein